MAVAGEISLAEESTSTVVSWYNTAWGKRRKISVDFTKVPSTLTDFPMLINTTDPLWAGGQADGGAFLFTSSDGTTKLDHEINKYDAGTGELIAWVEVPTLSSSTGTDIYIYYDNSKVSIILFDGCKTASDVLAILEKEADILRRIIGSDNDGH